MKLILLTLVVGCASFSFGQSANLLNPDFENWSIDTTVEISTWTTNGAFDEKTAKKVANAQNQNFAVELTTREIEGDTVAPELLYADFTNGFAGRSYTSLVDSMIFYAKYDIPANTNGEVVVIQFNQGVQTQTVMEITGTQSTWKRMGIELNGTTQDSIVIAVSPSSFFGSSDPIPGSTITVDNFSFKGLVAGAALTNFSLENYDTSIVQGVNDYITTNPAAGFLNYNGNFVTRTTDKQNGTYAARLETIDFGSQFGPIPGIISNALDNQFQGTNGQPYTAQPDSLIGWYKYAPAAGDAGAVYVAFTKNGTTVADGTFDITAAQGTYKRFGFKFTFTDVPDSMAITVYSGGLDGTVLFVDNFAFKGGNVGITENTKLVSLIYPNPATEEIMVTLNARPESIQIMDIQGQVIKTIRTNSILTSVNISELASGTYLVNVISKEGVATTKFVKK
jgi:hypothetical protein